MGPTHRVRVGVQKTEGIGATVHKDQQKCSMWVYITGVMSWGGLVVQVSSTQKNGHMNCMQTYIYYAPH